jgi:hypothetical protein
MCLAKANQFSCPLLHTGQRIIDVSLSHFFLFLAIDFLSPVGIILGLLSWMMLIKSSYLCCHNLDHMKAYLWQKKERKVGLP